MSRRRSVLAWAIVTLVLVAGLTASLAAEHQDRESRRRAGDDRAAAVALRLREADADGRRAVAGLRAFFRASREVGPAEFRIYARTLMDGPGVVAVRYLERVPPSRRRAWEARAGVPIRLPGLPRLFPDAQRDAYVITYTHQPGGDGSPVSGLDASLDPGRWRAMVAARDSGQVRATTPVALLGVPGTGFHYYAALYGPGPPPRTIAGRRRRIVGFVTVAVRGDRFARAIAALIGPGTEMRIADGPETLAQVGALRGPTATRLLPVSGRGWWVTTGDPAVGTAVGFLPAGVALLVAITVVAWVALAVRRERYAEALIAIRQRERDDAEGARDVIERLHRAILDSSADAILTVGADGRVRSANPAAEAVLGWSPKEVVGRPFDDLVPPPRGDEEGAARTALHRDGRHIPVLVSLGSAEVGGEPLRVAILHDISRRLRREQDIRALAAEQAGMLRVATAVAADEGEQAVLIRLAQEACDAVGAARAGVFRLEPGQGTVRVAGMFARRPGPAMGEHLAVPAGFGALAEALVTGRTARSARNAVPMSRADRMYLQPYAVTVCTPIRVDGVVWGFLGVAAVDEGDLAPDTEERLERFASLAALAVTSADARRQLATMARTDHLTGLANQRAFHERLDEELARARRDGRPLSLVVLDVDHFKCINDQHGHGVGDQVLAEFARRLTGLVRAGELVARVGGEEFAWILPEADGMRAFRAAERARRMISALPFPAVGTVTVSAGVCDTEEAQDAAHLFRLADMALYWAKGSGRDRSFRYVGDAIELLSADEQSRRMQRERSSAVIRALAQTIDARDPSTRRHSERVTAIAVRLAEELGWSAERVGLLEGAALVHDVGKVGIPDSILFKSGALTDEEYARVREHPVVGAHMVADVLSAEQTEWVRHHHERHDGRGYPDRVSGDDLSEGARILAVADAWDAMTAARPYGTPRSPESARDEVVRESGGQFCPRVVAAVEALWERGEPRLRGVQDATHPLSAR